MSFDRSKSIQMNKLINNFKPVLLGMILLLTFSCSDDQENQLVQEQTVSSTEVVNILDIDSQSRVIDDIITDLFQDGKSGKSSKMEDCFTAEYTDTGYTVTFDNCSIDNSDNITGSLSVVYETGEEETAFTATYTNISVGGIVINGTRAFNIMEGAEQGSYTFNIMSDMNIELADGSTIEESGSKNFELVIDSENFANSTLEISGNWTVKADGNTYVVNITSPLIINILSCEYVSSGVMSLNKNGLAVTIDFGDGSCDEVATLTYPDGTMEEIALND